MTLGFMAVHIQTQHRKAMEGRHHWGARSPVGEPCTYEMAFPTTGGTMNCPVEGCWGRAATRTAMRVHFFYSNVQDILNIL